MLACLVDIQQTFVNSHLHGRIRIDPLEFTKQSVHFEMLDVRKKILLKKF